MYDVITIGSATIDAFLVSKAFKVLPDPRAKNRDKMECIPFGAKIELDDFYLTTGGGATNAAATFASLGLKTAIVTRIGDDASGAEVLKDLKNRHIATTLIKTVKNGITGYGSQLVAPGGERSVLVSRGVSASFTDRAVTTSKLKSKWIYMSSLAGNTNLALRVAKAANKKRYVLRTILDPAN